MSKTEMPSIRFYGFDNDWEQRKLGDIVERVVRKNTSNESSLPLTISAQYGLVDQITYFNNRVASRDVSNYYLVLNGEFAYNKSTSDGFPFGAVKRLDLYEKGVLSTLYIVFSIKNQSEIDSDYLTVFFDTDRWHKGVSERAAEGARNHGLLNISADDFFDIDIFLPRHKEEQVAIGSYLRHLDHLITLHQRKLEKLTNVKKSMLEKMFPRNGSCYPEIRFKGFTDPWEQRKLGELISEYKETVDSSCTLPVLTSSKTEGVILQEEHFGRKQQHDITGYNVLPRSYCTYRNRSDGVDFTFNVNECCDMGIISKFYPVFCGNDNDTYFLSLVLNNSDEVVHEIAYTCTGTGQKVLSFLDLQKMSIRVPRHNEQKKISTYFKQLDHLITLHQRELEKLQSIKKALLEKMFV